jgi:RNA polymerase sigma factor (TIGR02999 family)
MAPAVQGTNELFDVLYPNLKRLAARCLAASPWVSLRPTELVSECWLRFEPQSVQKWPSREYFLCVAAEQIRRVLVDHARRKFAEVRGGGTVTVSLEDVGELLAAPDADVLALDDALTAFAALDSRAAKVVEMRIFTGCTMQEAADGLGVSLSVAERDWRAAKAWLRAKLT